MRECSQLIFLTLVVVILMGFQSTFSWSAPNQNIKPILNKEPIQTVNDPSLAEAAAENKKEDQIIQFTIGILSGQVTKNLDSKKNQTISGLTYDWQDIDQNYYSISGKWLSMKAAWLEAGKKFLIFKENLYEPYYKLSLIHIMDPDDAVAGITRIESYKAGVSLGFIDLWNLGRLVTVEIGAQIGMPGVSYNAQIGAQWSF